MIKRLTLKELRNEDGLTQKQAASELGVSHDTIKRWESGETYPTVPDILKLCKLYRTSFDKIDFEAPEEKGPAN